MERAARGPFAQPFGEALDAGRGVEQKPTELDHLDGVEPGELDAHRALAQRDQAYRLTLLVARAFGDDDHERPVGRELRETRQHSEAVVVGAVHVVDLHDERLVLADVGEPLLEPAVDHGGLGAVRGHGRAEAEPQVGTERHERGPEGRSVLARELRRGVGQAQGERPGRPARLPDHAGVDPDDEGAGELGACPDLFEQAAPAHAGDALDPDRAAPAQEHRAHERLHSLERLRAADEARVRQEAQGQASGLGRALCGQLADARQAGDDLRGARGSAERVGVEEAEDQGVELLRDVRGERGRRRRRRAPVGG